MVNNKKKKKKKTLEITRRQNNVTLVEDEQRKTTTLGCGGNWKTRQKQIIRCHLGTGCASAAGKQRRENKVLMTHFFSYLCIWIPCRAAPIRLWCGGRKGRDSGVGSRLRPAVNQPGRGGAGNDPTRQDGSRIATCSPTSAKRVSGWAVQTGHAEAMSSCCCSTSWTSK